MTEFNPPPFAPGPMPVETLIYSTPTANGRPGVITAVGVMSIIVASISILVSIGFCFYGVILCALSNVSRMAPAAATTTTTTTSATSFSTSVVVGSGRAGTSTTTVVTTAPAAPAGASQPLTAAEVQTVVQKAQTLSGNVLTPAQVAALQTELQDPANPLITPGTAWSGVNSVQPQADGSVYIAFSGGNIQLDPQAQVVSKTSYANAAAGMSMFKIGMGGPIVMTITGALSIGLAVLLLIAGIGVIRSSPSARRLHTIYAVTKIPLSLIAASAVGWIIMEFSRSFAGAAGPAASKRMLGTIAAIYVLIPTILSCLYPIALLIVMRTRAVRAYYNSIVR